MKEKLINFPVSFFSVVMGLTGYVIATQKLNVIYGIDHLFSNILLYLDTFVLIILSIIYLTKILMHHGSFKEEFDNPVRMNFFPTFNISLLLLSIAFLELNIQISKYLWIVGTIIQIYLTFKILSLWVWQTRYEIKHFNPSWLIPIVGNLLVPVSGIVHLSKEPMWIFYSVGIVFWIIMFSLILNRIVFHHPLSQKLLPTFFILIAPPAVGFISYVKLVGEVDSYAKILYYFALFLTLFLLTQWDKFIKSKFFLSWWAYLFPLGSMAISTSLMYSVLKLDMYKYIFISLYSIMSILLLILLFKTFNAMKKHEICVPEE
jgi:tellurite resistance protein